MCRHLDGMECFHLFSYGKLFILTAWLAAENIDWNTESVDAEVYVGYLLVGVKDQCKGVVCNDKPTVNYSP